MLNPDTSDINGVVSCASLNLCVASTGNALSESATRSVASILRDRRFSSSPVHRLGYRPPSYPPGDPRA